MLTEVPDQAIRAAESSMAIRPTYRMCGSLYFSVMPCVYPLQEIPVTAARSSVALNHLCMIVLFVTGRIYQKLPVLILQAPRVIVQPLPDALSSTFQRRICPS